MSAEAKKTLIRSYFAAIDEACMEGNADIIDEFLAPDFVEHNPFPGIDKLLGRVTAYEKHEGELFGIPRTGKDIRVAGIAIWRIRDGRIVEHWHETDQVALLQQTGVLPESE